MMDEEYVNMASLRFDLENEIISLSSHLGVVHLRNEVVTSGYIPGVYNCKLYLFEGYDCMTLMVSLGWIF